jgi:hypothetical protein
VRAPWKLDGLIDRDLGIRTRVMFHRVRHLKNPFNGNREVKISRDGWLFPPFSLVASRSYRPGRDGARADCWPGAH